MSLGKTEKPEEQRAKAELQGELDSATQKDSSVTKLVIIVANYNSVIGVGGFGCGEEKCGDFRVGDYFLAVSGVARNILAGLAPPLPSSRTRCARSVA